MALSLSFYESIDSSEYALMHHKVFLLFDVNNKQCIVDTLKIKSDHFRNIQHWNIVNGMVNGLIVGLNIV